MANQQDATELLIKAKNLTQEAFAQVTAALKELKEESKGTGKGLGELGDVTGLVSKTASDLGDHIKATALGFISAKTIVGDVKDAYRTLAGFITGSVESYASAEAAAKKMTAALVSQGHATPDVIAQYNQLASQFQRTTVYSDDLVNEMESLLTQVGDVAPAQMGKALTAATDLASGLGVDLQTATMLVAKAFAGHTESLSKYGIVLDEAKVKTEGVTYVLEQIQSRFGGQAQSEAETYAGRIKQIANAWDNVKEAVGQQIVTDPVLIAALRQVKDAADGTAEGGNLATAAWESFRASSPEWLKALGGLHNDLIAVADAENTMADAATRMNAVAAKSPLKQGAAFSFADIDAKAKQTIEETIDAWKKQDEAAKRHAETIQQLSDKYSGTELARKVRDLAEAMRTLKPGADFKVLAGDIGRLFQEGARLTPEMMQLAIAFGTLTPPVTDGIAGLGTLGEKFDILVPKVMDFARLLPDVKSGISNIIGEIPKMDLGFQFDLARPKAHRMGEEVRAVGQAFDELSQLASGDLANIMQSIGGVSGALQNAIALQSKVNQSGGLGGSDGSTAKTVGNIALLATGYGAVAVAAIKAGKAIYTAMNDGRKAVEDFADSMGGFPELHTKLQAALGDVGENFWVELTQRIKRGDKKGADALIAEIQGALANAPNALAAAAGYQTKAELQTVADKAKEVYDYMVSSGQYTASTIADAFTKMQEAQTTALGEEAAAASAAMQKAHDDAKAVVDGLDQQLKSLQDSIANEAPEEVMGIVEANTRAQIAAVTAQRKDAQDALDQVNQQIQDAADAALAATQKAAEGAGKAAVFAIQQALDGADFHIRFSADGEPGGTLPGHADGAYIRDTHVATVHRGEMVGGELFMARALAGAMWMTGNATAGGDAPFAIAPVMLDGKKVSDIIVRRTAGSVRRFGGRR